LARRWRLLFLDARQAGAVARKVGDILAQETGVDPQVEAFQDMTRLYLTLPL
jgi:glycerol-3-phosphate dehydrogenase